MASERSLLERIDAYVEDLFIGPDEVLAQNQIEAAAAGLPPIAVSANQGKLLSLLVAMIRARRVLEIGTLGGYSTAWLARALPADGRIVSLELDAKHAAVARRNLDRVPNGARVDIRVGAAAATLQAMIAAGEPPFDLIFIDADKPGYSGYLDQSLRLSRPGTVIVADNVIRNGAVMEQPPPDANARAMREFNARLSADARLDAIIVPMLKRDVDGFAIAVVK